MLPHFSLDILTNWSPPKPFSTNIIFQQPHQQELSHTHEPASPLHTHVTLKISTTLVTLTPPSTLLPDAELTTPISNTSKPLAFPISFM